MDEIIIGSFKFKTKVAVTDEEHEYGLMNVQWPPPVMTFHFKDAAVRKFWMKDTPSPLDIIFCNSGKVVKIEDGKPLSLNFVGPNFATDMVIEMPKGSVERYGIKVGDNVDLKSSMQTYSKILADKYPKIVQ